MRNLLKDDSLVRRTGSIGAFTPAGTNHKFRYRPRWERFVIAAAAVMGASMLLGQSSPHLAGVEPATGKVGASVAVTGENLGKGSVAAIFLSDDKADFKAALVSQAADKIVFKVPDVKPGDYNLSIQVNNNIFIQPLRFTVEG